MAKWILVTIVLVIVSVQSHSQDPAESERAVTTTANISAISSAIVALIAAGSAVVGFVVRPFRRMTSRFDKLEEKLTDVATDVHGIKSELPHLEKRLSNLELRR